MLSVVESISSAVMLLPPDLDIAAGTYATEILLLNKQSCSYRRYTAVYPLLCSIIKPNPAI